VDAATRHTHSATITSPGLTATDQPLSGSLGRPGQQDSHAGYAKPTDYRPRDFTRIDGILSCQHDRYPALMPRAPPPAGTAVIAGLRREWHTSEIDINKRAPIS
jgi:hypothetical protein